LPPAARHANLLVATDIARRPFARLKVCIHLPPPVERMRTSKYALAGTVDQVKAEIDALKRIYGDGNGNLEWFAWFFDQGMMSWDEEMRQMELFAEHIIPTFR